jgi:hypothetical protein
VGAHRKPCTSGMVRGLKGLTKVYGKMDKYRTITTQPTSPLSIDTYCIHTPSGEELVLRATYGSIRLYYSSL